MSSGHAETDEEPSDSAGYWSASAVARQLGMSTVTLRTWNRRYGIGPTGHQPGQHRSYSDADVWTLQRMQRLIGSGIRPAAAARIAVHAATTVHATDSRLQPVDAIGGTTPNERVQILVTAAYHLDSETARATLDVDFVEHGVIATWDSLCRPALTLICPPGPPGPNAQGGQQDVEHLLSWCILVSLHKLSAFAPRPTRPILLACGETERHTLALEALQAALRHNRISTRMLGADTPSDAIVRSFDRAQRSAGAIVWSQRAATAHLDLLEALPADALVVAAGPGWDGLDLPDRVHNPQSLSAALGIVRTHVGRPPIS